jgi:hypothetical protein
MSAEQRARDLVTRLNGGGKAGTGSDAAASFLKRVVSAKQIDTGKRPILQRANRSVTDVVKEADGLIKKARKPKLKDRPLAKKAGSDVDDAIERTEEFAEALGKDRTGKRKPNRNTLKGTERSLGDGFEEGFPGVEQPYV